MTQGLACNGCERQFTSDQVHVAEALDCQRLVGFIAFNATFVDHLYLLPTVQRRGIGTRLLATAKSNASRLRLWTFQRNVAARAFYEAQGFRVIRATDGAGNEEREPDLLLEWQS